MVTIYTEHITTRLTYVLDFCFTEKGQKYQLISTAEEWRKLPVKCINYSNQELECLLQIDPQGMLFESEIYQCKALSLSDGNIKIDGVSDDFGVIFYLLSRYKSYFSQNLDTHGRLTAEQNILVQFGLNKTAIVDRKVKSIWEKINLDYTTVQNGFKYIPTFDIDIAWAYKHRKFIRSVGAMLKGKKPIERFKVFAGVMKDPYDTYAQIRDIASKTEEIISFTLLGDWGKYDKNIHWENFSYGSLIRGLNLAGGLGIHPSYASYLNKDQVAIEINRLEKITGHEIRKSRQHFLRLKIPETYKSLIEVGIEHDYSMGFADNIGFRAGTSFRFHYFDLIANKSTPLWVHPFTYMDSAMKDYLKLNPDQAKATIDELMLEVKSVGGQFISIWHNSSIHNRGEWKGWKAVLDYTVEKGLDSA
ncbi:MAG: polysaccharide deacetylase family protein [Crocinitomix sp.]|nr:polysaccharide deacetylase family protein [Crocinitomix sp.]